MSINHPKPRQIRLPFSVPKPGRTTATRRLCGVCRKTEGKYTCPRCNIVYCSLACFRDEAHAQCSEPFYKSTVLEAISADPKVELDEKRKMMEMLRRFEEAQLEGEDVDDLLKDEDDEEDELEKALNGVDLDDLDSNKLFHLLPQQHRDAFLAAIRNPESQEAKDLLASAVEQDDADRGEGPSLLPWWEKDRLAGASLSDDLDEESIDTVQYAEEPTLVTGLEGINPPPGIGMKLVYNAVALAMAYIHVCLSFRLPSLDTLYLEKEQISPSIVKADLGRLLPFLVDSKSTLRYTSVREAYSAIWEKLGDDLNNSTSSRSGTDLLIRLLEIVVTLLHPPITTDPPHLLLLLSDVYRLFAPAGAKHTPAERKLGFYLVALKQLSRPQWLSVKAEMEKEVRRLRDELGVLDPDQEVVDEGVEERENLRVI